MDTRENVNGGHAGKMRGDLLTPAVGGQMQEHFQLPHPFSQISFYSVETTDKKIC